MGVWLLGVGDCDPVVSKVKTRLGFHDCSDVVTEQLVQRVRGLQLVHEREPDGVLDDWLCELLGVDR